MIVKFDSLNRMEQPLFFLCNPGSTYEDGKLSNVIGGITNTEAEENIFNFNAPSELNMRVNRPDDDSSSAEPSVLEVYEAIENRRLIFISNIGFFVISHVDETKEENRQYKDMTAQSLEKEIEQKEVPYIEDGTYPFSTINDKIGLFDKIVQVIPSWTVGHVDASVASKYRTFEDVGTDLNCYSFMINDMQSAYECIFEFDSVSRQISVYDQANYVKRTNIHISNEDVVDMLKISDDSEDLYTAIHVSGVNDLNIAPVNPIGGNTIYDFSYYLDWMSPGLRSKLTEWAARVEWERGQHYPEMNYRFYSDLYYYALEQVSTTRLNIEALDTQIDIYNRCRSNVVASQAGEDEVTEHTVDMTELYNEALDAIGGSAIVVDIDEQVEDLLDYIDDLIAAAKSEKDSLLETLSEAEDSRDSALQHIEEISGNLSLTNILTESEYEELSKYIFEANYNDEYITVTDSMTLGERMSQMDLLYTRAVEQLRRISKPKREFSIDVESFVFEKEFSNWTSQLETGCLIDVDIKEGETTSLFLSSITINYDDKSMTLKFGSGYDKYDTASLFNDVLGSVSKSANSINYIKEQIYPIKVGKIDELREAIENARALSMTNALAAQNQAFVIDGAGITGRKVNENNLSGFDDQQVKMTSNLIVFTDDAWQTCKVAIGDLGNGQYGINAETIIGNLIIGNDLILSGILRSANNTFVLNMETGELTMTPLWNSDISTAVAGVESDLNTAVTNLQNQIDGAIETYSGSNAPTLSNYPASSWSQSDYDAHVGDLFVGDTGSDIQGFWYRFQYNNSTDTYSWVQLKDNDIQKAIQDAADAVATANAASDTADDALTKANASVRQADVEYYKSTSSSTQTGGSWQSTSPTWENGYYIWTRTKFTPVSGAVYYSNPVCITGNTGASGSQGDSAVTYSITPSVFAVVRDSSGSPTPGSVTFTATKSTGNGNPESFSGVFVIETSTDGSSYSAVSGTGTSVKPSESYTVVAGVKFIRCRLYANVSKTAILDEQSVAVVSDGTNGTSYYTYVRYSQNSDGNPMVATPTSATKYIGVYSGTSASVPAYSAFTWSKYAGDDGAQGEPGPNGKTYYTWIKYADNASGDGMSDNPSGKAYIGIATNKESATESAVPSDYTWSKYVGNNGTSYYTYIRYADDNTGSGMSTSPAGKSYLGIHTGTETTAPSSASSYVWSKYVGDDGLPGEPGNDGQTLYTWIKYADDANGTNMSDSPTGKKYIGIAYNKTTSSESSTASDYTWSKYVGEDGHSSYTYVRYSVNSNGNPMVTTPSSNTKYIGLYTGTSASVPAYSAFTWSKYAGEDGSPGEQGDDGKTFYTWIKYADDASGNGMADSPAGKKYIGIATNKESATESTTASDYTWSKYVGDNGTSYYTYIRYADDSSGSGMSTSPSGKSYLGIHTGTETTAPTSASSYVWSKYVGEDGLPGEPGDNGITFYTWIKYADDANGTNMSNSPVGKKYIGIAYNKESSTESNVASDYTWSRYTGEDGEDAYTVIFTNENHTFVKGVVSSAVCQVIVYKGATQIACTLPSSVTCPSGMSYTRDSNGTASVAGQFTIATTTAFATANGTLDIAVAADGKTFTKKFSYSLVEDGTSVTITDTEIRYIAWDYGDESHKPGDSANWQSTIPTVNEGQYLWTRTKVTFSQGSPVVSYSVAYKGTNGGDGTSSYTHIRYANSANPTTWSQNPAGMTYIGIAVTDSSTPPSSASEYQWSKFVGEDGDPGNGITSISYFYLATADQTQPSANDTHWSTTVPTLSSSNKYLWQKQVIDFSDASYSDQTTIVLIGVYSESVSIQYMQTTSNSIVRTGNGDCSPDTITLTAFSKTGMSDPTSYRGRFAVYGVQENGDYAEIYRSASDESEITVSFMSSGTLVIESPSTDITVENDRLVIHSGAYISGNTLIIDNNPSVRILENNPLDGIRFIKCYLCESGGTNTILDNETIVIVTDGPAGDGGYSVILTNENHTFAGDASAALPNQSTQCQVVAYKGSTAIAAHIGTPTGMPTGMTVTVTGNNTTSAGFTVAVGSTMNTRNGVVNIPVTLDYNTANASTFDMKFTYSLALVGVGVDSIIELYYLSASATAPAKPTAAVTTNTDVTEQWTKQVPTWSEDTSYYYTCSEIHYDDGSIEWTDPVGNTALTQANQVASNAGEEANTATTIATNAAEAAGDAADVAAGAAEAVAELGNDVDDLGSRIDANENDISELKANMNMLPNGMTLEDLYNNFQALQTGAIFQAFQVLNNGVHITFMQDRQGGGQDKGEIWMDGANIRFYINDDLRSVINADGFNFDYGILTTALQIGKTGDGTSTNSTWTWVKSQSGHFRLVYKG